MKKTTWVFPIERLYLVRCILIKLVAFSIQFIIQSREVRSFARETESIRWRPNLGILSAGATNSTHCFYTKETAKLSIKRQEKSKREKSKKKSRETTKLKATSIQAESESASMQTHAYFRNRLHTEDPKETEEEKRREIRDAENLVFFRTMAQDSEFWKPSILEPLPGSNGSSTSQKQTRLTGYRAANSGFAKSSDIGMLLGGSRRKESAIPNDPANYVSENQAEENMLFFKYVARNRSFFQFKES